jgi:hypothetical protein
LRGMTFMYTLYQQPATLVLTLLVLGVWVMIWKGIALWFSAKSDQKGWFVILLVLNTVGLLPIIYLLWFRPTQIQKKKENVVPPYQDDVKGFSAKKAETEKSVIEKKSAKKKVRTKKVKIKKTVKK